MRRTAKIVTHTPHLPFRALRRFSFILTALVLVIGVVSAQAQHRTFTVPFHSINGLVLLDATVNGKPAVLLIDTGSDATLIGPQAAGLPTLVQALLTVRPQAAFIEHRFA